LVNPDFAVTVGYILNLRGTVPSVTPSEELMRKIALAILLFLSAHAWATDNPNSAEYAVTIHVSSSNIAVGGRQELLCECATGMILALGDYKAKLFKDEHKTAYDSVQVYEILFADKKTRRFEVVGQTE
jgi:hypothetical protein